MAEGIQVGELKDRQLYQVRGRNLTFAVWRAETACFIGIRTKFESQYLDSEIHVVRDSITGRLEAGTCWATKELPERLPEWIPNLERLPGSQCSECGGMAVFEETNPEFRTGVWHHLSYWKQGEGEPECPKAQATAIYNSAFHRWIEAMELRYKKEK